LEEIGCSPIVLEGLKKSWRMLRSLVSQPRFELTIS
jgi:hypothetical protein